MKIPKVTSILLVVLTSLTLLNFVLKYYTYFVLMVSSSKTSANEVNSIAQETGEVPHPHELYVPLLTFIPTRSPVFTRPWVLVTSSFIEENFVGLTLSFMLFFYMGKYLETMWGSKEFTEFIICNVIISNVALFIYYSIKLVLFDPESYAVPPVVITALAINMGFFVAIKQRIPNHYFLFFKGNVRLKVTYIPFILVSLVFVLLLVSEEFFISLLLSGLGFSISWSYLRFFKAGTNERQSYLLPFSLSRKRSNKSSHPVRASREGSSSSASTASALHLDHGLVRGDRSEQFSLYTFFPYPLSIPVKLVSGQIFNTMVRYKFLNKKDFYNEPEGVEDAQMEEIDALQNTFLGVSSLKGAGNVSALPRAGSFNSLWNWFKSGPKKVGIKSSMEKRRKLALKELE
ncbi:DUF1751-domain-containing protein [Suhomyces tanzawaensis NRRL Y-17324]|uniref:DUF1751-domain-containing protein n=1 Tax=Suhomyces tanzawaensis NRRL Y-17324 TaxID=984487 RepID=A0A1E4SFN3_9ASCO|nr:DUF1751-domain-containing protein [Suhomyces tanzawaensis NRRL Y-17324]ODV78212.1 DUF1751-domain-containing protein [Suhomyces tanzawaensis NRRL Y-17324]